VADLVESNPGALSNLADKIGGVRLLKVGFLMGATYYPDGTSVAAVAAYNEFGVPTHNQPPRPFFRNMIAAQSGKWGRMAAVLLKQHDLDVDVTLDDLGREIQERIKESITLLLTPKLADITIARKGFSKPLIETALMLNSTGHQVIK
jgi:hypothetical protein